MNKLFFVLFFATLTILLFPKVFAVTGTGAQKPLVTSSGSLSCDQYCIRYYRASDASCSWFLCPTNFESTGSSLGCGFLRICCCKRGDKPPSVTISHLPDTVREGDKVTYTATATDDYNLKNIEIFVDGKSVNKCYVSGTSATCRYTGGPYSAASTHSYYARAYDDANQVATSSVNSFTVFYAPGGTCVRANPTVSITPDYQAARAGTTLTYYVNIKNNDNSYCNISKFYISMSEYYTAWSYKITQNLISIPPGNSATTSLLVTSPNISLTSPIKYSFAISVSNYEANQYQSTASATYEVLVTPAPPTTYGNFIFYPDLGVSGSWIKLSVKDTGNNLIETLDINQGENVYSEKIGLNIKLLYVYATQDYIVTDYKLEIAPISTACTDSDGGINYYVKGTCEDSRGVSTRSTDYCLSNTEIQEYWCNQDFNWCASTSGSCESLVGPGYVCKDGACVLEPKPDIAVLQIISYPTSLPFLAGNVIIFEVTFANIGNKKIDTPWSIKWNHQGGRSVNSSCSSSNLLAPNENFYCTISLVYDSPGNYTIEVIADGENYVNELDETNNKLSFSFYVYPTTQTPEIRIPTTTTIKTTTTSTIPTTTTIKTTTTLPSYTPCPSGYSCISAGEVSAYCYGCDMKGTYCDCQYKSPPCDQKGNDYCCRCIQIGGPGPIPAGILGNLWDFIKSLLGIK
ncbi:MAG: CARDB domain-containing protein [Candidatus Aenigmatarchaeota archaeon]